MDLSSFFAKPSSSILNIILESDKYLKQFFKTLPPRYLKYNHTFVLSSFFEKDEKLPD